MDELIERKRRIFGWYEEEFEGVPGVSLNREADWARSIYWMPRACSWTESLPVERDALRRRLKERHGVDTRSVFPAISGYPIWGTAPQALPVAAPGSAGALFESSVRRTTSPRAHRARRCRRFAELGGALCARA